MAGALLAGVPLGAADAAQDTLGGPVEVAGQLPGQLALVIIDAAREAFMQELRLAAGISVVGSIGLALLAGGLSPGGAGSSGSESESELESDGADSGSSPRDEAALVHI